MKWKAPFLLIFVSFQYHHAPYCVSFCLHHRWQRTHYQQQLSSHRRRKTVQFSSISVYVYDNVFDAGACSLLHDLAVDHSERCDSGSIFIRTPDRKDQLTPLEKAMDTALEALNDTSPIVEYWSRSSYINIDAHADIDENTLKQDGVLKCPRNAHVLYLQVVNSGEVVSCAGDDSSKRMGPTVVFPKRTVAWGSVASIPSLDGDEKYVVNEEFFHWDEDINQQHERISDATEKREEMAIVPAVTGRLLRFDGRAFHAVPKPPHRYLMSKNELNEYLEGEDGDCDDDDDHWDNEFHDYEEEKTDLDNLRSVLLFNTWPEGSSGPNGVLQDMYDVDVPDDIELYSSSYYDYQLKIGEKRRRDWQTEYGDEFESLWCKEFDEWKCALVDRISDEIAGKKVTVPLMGNQSRRGWALKQDVLHGPIEGMDMMFYDGTQVSLLDLE